LSRKLRLIPITRGESDPCRSQVKHKSQAEGTRPGRLEKKSNQTSYTRKKDFDKG